MERYAHARAFLIAAVLSLAGWIPEARALCDGLQATTGCNGPAGGCQGTSAKNVIMCLAPEGCVIDGAANNDIIFNPGGGPIVACGGSGHDIVMGGDLADTLLGGEGHDVMIGAGEVDYLDGGWGTDFLIGDGMTIADPFVGDECVAGEVKFTCL